MHVLFLQSSADEQLLWQKIDYIVTNFEHFLSFNMGSVACGLQLEQSLSFSIGTDAYRSQLEQSISSNQIKYVWSFNQNGADIKKKKMYKNKLSQEFYYNTEHNQVYM